MRPQRTIRAMPHLRGICTASVLWGGSAGQDLRTSAEVFLIHGETLSDMSLRRTDDKFGCRPGTPFSCMDARNDPIGRLAFAGFNLCHSLVVSYATRF